jgi:Immunity protein family (Imm11)
MTANIYKLYVQSEGHPYLLQEKENEEEGYRKTLIAGLLPPDWQPPKFSIHRRSSKLADAILWQTHSPLISERAVQLLKQAAPDCAEYRFFAEIKGKPYFMMNVLATQPLSILDEERTTFARGADGNIGQIYRYVIKRDKYQELPPLFRIAFMNYPDHTILVTEAIPGMVVAERLTGFEFRNPNNPTEMKDLYLGKDLNVYPGVLP